MVHTVITVKGNEYSIDGPVNGIIVMLIRLTVKRHMVYSRIVNFVKSKVFCNIGVIIMFWDINKSHETVHYFSNPGNK